MKRPRCQFRLEDRKGTYYGVYHQLARGKWRDHQSQHHCLEPPRELLGLRETNPEKTRQQQVFTVMSVIVSLRPLAERNYKRRRAATLC